jgi:hypothetical protein
MTEPEEETFSVGLRLGGAEIIGFHISARSTRIKRWAFFGLLTMIVVLLFAMEFAPELERFSR